MVVAAALSREDGVGAEEAGRAHTNGPGRPTYQVQGLTPSIPRPGLSMLPSLSCNSRSILSTSPISVPLLQRQARVRTTLSLVVINFRRHSTTPIRTSPIFG